MSGGPMYYIEKGLGWKWLAVLFAVFASIAAFGIGNMVQSNAVAGAASTFNIPTWATGIALTLFAGLVILGGIKSIGRVTAYFVPIMALFYVLGGLIIIVLNLDLLPGALGLIFTEAFTGSALVGGGIGAAIRYGVARGVFSNEAGLGSAPIAAAAAKTDYPGRQALVSMTQVFIDTIIVCSITGVILTMGGMYGGEVEYNVLTSETFSFFLGDVGGWIVALGIIFFASSTILGWSYYGEKSFAYLFGDGSIKYYRIVFVLAVYVGAVANLDLVWDISDVMNGLMAFPNLIGLLALSGVVVAETKTFLKKAREERGEHLKAN
jgi:AGCS family alanine or glycine:cation symporter